MLAYVNEFHELMLISEKWAFLPDVRKIQRFLFVCGVPRGQRQVTLARPRLLRLVEIANIVRLAFDEQGVVSGGGGRGLPPLLPPASQRHHST